MTALDEYEQLTPYQRRIYGAVVHGYDMGRSRTNRVLRLIWKSRRHLQSQNESLRARIRLIEALATDAQIGERSPKAGVRADWINHVLNDTKTPEGFDAWKAGREA